MIGLRFKPRAFPRRGPTDSDALNAMTGEIGYDLSSIVTEVNALGAEIDRTHLIRFHEMAALRAHTDRLIADRQIRNAYAAAAGDPIITVVDFRGLLGPEFELSYDNIPSERRARVEPLYGQVILPYNNAVNRIYGVRTDTDDVTFLGTVTTTVTGYDQGGTAVTGTAKNAVNGNNQDYWIRKVKFPVASDVDYVEAEFQVDLPGSYVTQTNMLTLHPFPLGLVDITEIKYSSTTADPSIDLPGFSAVNCASFQRWHYSAITTTKIKIKLRQRHFIEENGYKVFYLGLQEVLLQLIDFDKTTVPATPSNGNGILVKIDAPSGYTFNQITRFTSSPAYAVAGSDNGIYYRIYSDSSLTTQQWYSFSDPAPQSTPLDLSSLGISSIYVLLNLEWNSNQSPVVENFALKYTVQ